MKRSALILLLLTGCSDDAARVDAGPPSDAGIDARPADASLADVAAVDAAPVDASGVDALPSCSSEGQVQVVACGNCGEQSQRCTGGFWVPQSACLNQGECAVGSVETGSLPLCGEQQRICNATCSWGGWSTTVPGTGDCEPGESRFSASASCRSPEVWKESCSSTCGWENVGCSDGCSDDPRTVPADAEEICIPAGSFIRGDTGFTNTVPVQTVYLSAYYIDKYSVTYRRYRECVDADACVVPTSTTYDITDTTKDAYVFDYHSYSENESWAIAHGFCEWDNARLPTEAEWEKAARGPAPREEILPWGGAAMLPYDCDVLCIGACDCYSSDWSLTAESYTRFPDANSYYGVAQMLGNSNDWVHDWYSATYYATASSLVDPVGPDSGTLHVMRGFIRAEMSPATHLTERRAGLGHTIRCARTPGLGGRP